MKARGKKRALARKLLSIAYRVLRSKTDHDPAKLAPFAAQCCERWERIEKSFELQGWSTRSAEPAYSLGASPLRRSGELTEPE